MSQEYKIKLDTLNHIPADILGMTVTKLYVDALTAFDRDCAWIQAKSDGGRTISDYLPFVYTMIDDDEGNQELQRSPKAIERGTFLD
jgi:hypothetical protein